MNPEPTPINKPVSLIYNEVKRRLEDHKTNWFIVITLVNVFSLGLMLAEYKQLQREVKVLQEKHDLTQVYINTMEKE